MMPSASAVVRAGVAVGGMEGGEAEAEDYGVGMGDADGLVEIVDAGGEEEMFAVG